MTTPQTLITPTPAHLAWADCEIGVIIHHDVQVYEPTYHFRKQWGYSPSPAVFNPASLDTDQWLATAASAGAKYAVLVAKHCSGFSLWPTGVHGYSVAASPWRGGKGDVVKDFFASCERFGIQPGLYASASCNGYLGVDNPGRPRTGKPEDQLNYNDIVMRQLTELWTNYGKVFEIWFDGGVLPVEQGGPDIASLLRKLQPDSVVFQGPSGCNLLRWGGNERGEAPDPCWATTKVLTGDDGTRERIDTAGDPDGRVWAPAESDMPNRDAHRAFQGGWFWRKDDEPHLHSVEHLYECYHTSVGRNSNLLLGMVIDDRGLVPDADCAQFAALGKRVRDKYGLPLASGSGTGNGVEVKLPAPAMIDSTAIMEDIRNGERIRAYTVEAQTPDGWRQVAAGTAVGHKKIDRFAPVQARAVRVTITKSVAALTLRSVEVFGNPR